MQTVIRVFIIGLIGVLIWGYYASLVPIDIVVNGTRFPVRVHRPTVSRVLHHFGITLKAEDRLLPTLNSRLTAGQTLDITLARPITFRQTADTTQPAPPIYTHANTPRDIYRLAEVELHPADEVYVNDQLWPHDQPLPSSSSISPNAIQNIRTRIATLRPPLVELSLKQAIPVSIIDGSESLSVWTTQPTVEALLAQQGMTLHPSDALSPPLNAPLKPNLQITIQRAIPITLQVDGRAFTTRTLHQTVAQLLAQEHVILSGQDYTIPAGDEMLAPEMQVQVIRVEEALLVNQERTDFETKWIPDETLEIDRQEVRQVGQAGVTKTRTRLRYENGYEVDRAEEETWLDQEASEKIVAYGTRVVVRTLETPAGEVEYWRKIKMLMTSYTAATSGKTPDHPAYGITRSGLEAGHGIVAVDPAVIDLMSELYIPGYGEAIAGDTGGGIIGKHVDLGYDEDNLKLWYGWQDVYLLGPPPPWHEIRYVLPQWPQER